jgi:carbamoyltransferase
LGNGAEIKRLDQVDLPGFPRAVLQRHYWLLEFEVNEGEYKIMGLAPYGQPKYLKQIGQLIEAGPGGEYRLNLNIIRSYKKTECFPRIFANCWKTRRALTDRRFIPVQLAQVH